MIRYRLPGNLCRLRRIRPTKRVFQARLITQLGTANSKCQEKCRGEEYCRRFYGRKMSGYSRNNIEAIRRQRRLTKKDCWEFIEQFVADDVSTAARRAKRQAAIQISWLLESDLAPNFRDFQLNAAVRKRNNFLMKSGMGVMIRIQKQTEGPRKRSRKEHKRQRMRRDVANE